MRYRLDLRGQLQARAGLSRADLETGVGGVAEA